MLCRGELRRDLRRPRPDAGSRGRDLAGLVLEELEPARELARSIDSAASAVRFSRQRSTAAAMAAPLPVVAAVRVEQVALPALVEQPLLLVLAVDLDERPGLEREPRRGDRLVVEARGGAAAAVTSRTAISGSGGAVEQRLDAGAVRAVANERRIGAGAERQPQRVDEQALARAGLAGEDVQPGARARAAAAR